MPAASTSEGTLAEGLKLALKAAKAHKVRNEGERSSVEMIVNMLQDCVDRVALLDTFAGDFERQVRVRAAEDELRAAQSA